MKRELNLEIYAIAVGVEGESGVGSVSHDLEIVTETDVLFLPISATVLTAYEYENREPNSPHVVQSPGTKLVSLRPPATTGIIRPRKESVLSGREPVRRQEVMAVQNTLRPVRPPPYKSIVRPTEEDLMSGQNSFRHSRPPAYSGILPHTQDQLMSGRSSLKPYY